MVIMAAEAVYDFLKEHNRPFSANDVLQSIGKEHGKAAVQKALDKLVDKKKVIEKAYGKQKVYCVVQDNVVNSSEMEGTLRKMEQEISELTTNLKSVEEQFQSKTSELKSLQNKMTTKEAKTELGNLKEEIKALKSKLNDFEENSKPISDEEKTKINKDLDKYIKEYRKRKRMCTDIINAILEGYPKTKKHLLEDIGIETDEDVGFKLE